MTTKRMMGGDYSSRIGIITTPTKKHHVAHIRVVWLFCVCLCVCVSCVKANNNSNDNDNNNTNTNTNKCQLYLAPTTVGGQKNGNYGIFTAVDLRQGDTVLANDGPNIPVLLMEEDEDDENEENDAEDSTDTTTPSSVLFPQTDHVGLFMNVWWGINSPASNLLSYGIDSDDDNMHVYDLQITFGALPNCHPYRSNLGTLYPRDGIDYNDRSYLTSLSILQSSSTSSSQLPDESTRPLPHQQNPLRGSFSYYTGKHFFIDIESESESDTDSEPVVVVPAGTELFLDYAEDWLQHGFPRKQDYYSAATLLRKWMLTLHHPTTTCTTTHRNNTTTTTTTTTHRNNNNNTSTHQRTTTTTRTKQKQEKSPFWKASVARIRKWMRQSLLQLNTHRKRNKRKKKSRDPTTRGRKEESENDKEKKECTVAATTDDTTTTTTALLASATKFLDHLRFLQQLLQVQTTSENHNDTADTDDDDESDITKGIFHIEELTTRIVSILVASAPTPEQLQRIHDLAWERHLLNQKKNRTSNNHTTTRSSSSSIPSVEVVAEAMYLISLPVPKTTLEFEQTGICLDHLVAGPSSIPLEVGHGGGVDNNMSSNTSTTSTSNHITRNSNRSSSSNSINDDNHEKGGDNTDNDEDINHTQSSSSSHYYTLGRGAIANRLLPKGTLIVPVPFLHLLDRSLFERTQKSSKNRGRRQPSNHTINNNDELLLNYCYGHFQSTLLLCPVTNAVLINHCSDRGGQFPCTTTPTTTTPTTTTTKNSNDGDGDVEDECDSDSDSDSDSDKNHHPNKKKKRTGPNAYYRWASESDWDPKTKRTLTMTLQEIAALDYHQQHRMLSMEIVASRDIQPGEEVFIDYGEKWEAAWLKHVQHWSSSNRRAEHNDNDDDTTNKNNNKNSSSSSSWWRGWSSSVTEFELNHHWYLLLNNDDDNDDDNDNDNNTNNNTNTNHDRSLFYGDLRAEQPAVSKDGRFMALCWYQDLFSREEGGAFGAAWGSNNKQDSFGEEEKKNQHRDDESWNKLSDEDIVEKYAINVDRRRTQTQTTKEKKRLFRHFEYDNAPGYYGHFWPCSIISKVVKDDEEQQQSSSSENEDEDEYESEDEDEDEDEDEYEYSYDDDDDEKEELFVVRIYPSQVHFRKYGKADYAEDAIHVLLTHYPRSSIKFVTLPYQSDQHHPQAFRHHIEIKNDMFPEQWKNKK